MTKIPDAGGAGNPTAALSYLQQLAAELTQKGLARSAVFAEVTRANAAHRLGVPDEDLGLLLNKLPSGSAKSVHQEHQENLNSQDEPRKAKETQREPASRPPCGRPTATNPQTATEVFYHELQSGLPSSLSLETYLAKAVDEFHRWEADEGDAGGWQSPLFYFVRLVKAHPAMAQATPKDAFRKVETVMGTWVTTEGPLPRQHAWEHWLGATRDDAEAEFLAAWDKIRYMPGYAPLDNAIELARRHPLQPRPEVMERRPDGYAAFISIAGWLQVGMGDANILLPVEDLAPLMGVQPVTISRYRRWAKEDGYLREVKAYKFAGKGRKGQATEFRFDVGRFQCLQDTARDGTEAGFEEAG